MTDRLVDALNRIAAAIERLAPADAPSPPVDCIRCAGRGWLGNRSTPCHACGGTGQQPS